MSQRTTTETCPRCGASARVSWLGIQAYGHATPDREEPISLDCPRGCYFATDELSVHFPPKVRVPG
jgi:hypothetical protein